MVKKTIEIYECDVCGQEAERYTVSYPDGVLVLDRCEGHARKIHDLRNETGSWASATPGRAAFKISSPEEIKRQMRSRKQSP